MDRHKDLTENEKYSLQYNKTTILTADKGKTDKQKMF